MKNKIIAMLMILTVLTLPLNVLGSPMIVNDPSGVIKTYNSFELNEGGKYSIPDSNFDIILNKVRDWYVIDGPTDANLMASVDLQICSKNWPEWSFRNCATYQNVEIGKTLEQIDVNGDLLQLTPKYVTRGDAGSWVTFSYEIAHKTEPKNQAPVITGVSGPQNLNVNEVGKWQINAYDPDGNYLSYSVNWGEKIRLYEGLQEKAFASKTQTSTFTHSYQNSGTYTVTFTVSDEKGESTQSTLTVDVNGNVINTYPDLAISDINFNQAYAGKEVDFVITVANYGGDAYSYSVEYNYGEGAGQGYATPQVIKAGEKITLKTSHTYFNAGDYKFTVKVGTNNDINKENNVLTKIVNVKSLNSNPVIDGVSGPQNLNVNEKATWVVKAHDEGKNLYYSVDWGEKNWFAPLTSSNSESIRSQEATFTHSYSNPGTYYVRFTVSDDQGNSAESSLTVNVGNGIIVPEPTPEPVNKEIKLKELYKQLLEIVRQILALQ